MIFRKDKCARCALSGSPPLGDQRVMLADRHLQETSPPVLVDRPTWARGSTALSGLIVKPSELPQAIFLRATEPRAARPKKLAPRHAHLAIIELVRRARFETCTAGLQGRLPGMPWEGSSVRKAVIRPSSFVLPAPASSAVFTTLTTPLQPIFLHRRGVQSERIAPAHHTPFSQADYCGIQISPSRRHTWRGKTRHQASAIEQDGSSHESASFHRLLPLSSENTYRGR